MEQELTPCPFDCGKHSSRLVKKEEPLRVSNTRRYWVECSCGARGPIAVLAREARISWNRRAQSTALPGGE